MMFTIGHGSLYLTSKSSRNVIERPGLRRYIIAWTDLQTTDVNTRETFKMGLHQFCKRTIVAPSLVRKVNMLKFLAKYYAAYGTIRAEIHILKGIENPLTIVLTLPAKDQGP